MESLWLFYYMRKTAHETILRAPKIVVSMTDAGKLVAKLLDSSGFCYETHTFREVAHSIWRSSDDDGS